jgi:anti-sigma factor RsiW
MLALIEGELEAPERARCLEHLKECSRCRAEFRGSLSLIRLLQEVPALQCPDFQVLDRFASDRLGGEEAEGVRAHLQLCPVCRETVAVLRASPEEQLARQEEERRAFNAAYVRDLAQSVAAEAVSRLLPQAKGVVERVWERVEEFAEKLRALKPSEWPSYQAEPQLAGALGFTGQPTAEVLAVATICTTTLAAFMDLTGRPTPATEEDAEGTVGTLAARFGAGPALRERLVGLLPELAREKGLVAPP